MDVREAWRAVRQWVPFTLRTVGYGTVSLTLGPLTKDRSASLWAMRNWCQASAQALDIEIEASGVETVPPAPFVYCSNHQSILDILVLGAVLPGDFKWAAKRSLMKIPFLGWHLQLAGHVPVDRRAGSRAAAEVIQRFVETLGRGKPLLVFPEGTRTATGCVQPFKSGGFYAAVRANVPVVPVALEGTHHLMKKGERDTGEDNVRHVRVRIGAPVLPKTEGREAHRVADLRDRTYAAIVDLHAAIGGTPPPPEQRAPAQSTRVTEARA
jgi:1-acyl-sn-glycerol-3-phosphate acyltransferase